MESNQEISISDFKKGECLGMGSFRSVYLVEYTATHDEFAMKESKFTSLKKEAGYLSFL